ncbi:MAG: hypothetical protein H7A33_08195 [Deltaproteobacteria bacterium]|nr:hypothetical protein [Deltaproteobacteria bacterium]
MWAFLIIFVILGLGGAVFVFKRQSRLMHRDIKEALSEELKSELNIKTKNERFSQTLTEQGAKPSTQILKQMNQKDADF